MQVPHAELHELPWRECLPVTMLRQLREEAFTREPKIRRQDRARAR